MMLKSLCLNQKYHRKCYTVGRVNQSCLLCADYNFLHTNKEIMYCEQCDMLIHEGELKWTKIYGQEFAFCPVHDELLKDSKKNY